jgi:hypothetical protein
MCGAVIVGIRQALEHEDPAIDAGLEGYGPTNLDKGVARLR